MLVLFAEFLKAAIQFSPVQFSPVQSSPVFFSREKRWLREIPTNPLEELLEELLDHLPSFTPFPLSVFFSPLLIRGKVASGPKLKRLFCSPFCPFSLNAFACVQPHQGARLPAAEGAAAEVAAVRA